MRIACVEAAVPEIEVLPEVPPPPPPPRVEVLIGRSGGNRRCVNAPGPVNCAVASGNQGIRINSDHARARDAFEVAVEGRQVCARRLDSNGGWGMNLKIACVQAEEAPPPPPPLIQVNIGRSGGNRKCVNAPQAVSCDSDAGDRGNRVNNDHANAGDSFDVEVVGNQVCASRTDRPDLGWGMNLQITCVEAEDPPPPPPPVRVEIQFGRSGGNRKCVDAPRPVACAADAGDRGNRINRDHARAGDSFEVVTEGNQVCAKRTDRADLGWGMNLQIVCVETDEFPAPPPAVVEVNIGRSGANRKCVDSPVPVSCDTDAGDRGNRINPDYARAGDSFDVVVEGRQVCAQRTDRPDLGWGMNLQIACVEAEAEPVVVEAAAPEAADYYSYYYYGA